MKRSSGVNGRYTFHNVTQILLSRDCIAFVKSLASVRCGIRQASDAAIAHYRRGDAILR